MTIFRSDYTPYPFWIPEINLHFVLDPHHTKVISTLRVQRKPDSTNQDLVLDGEGLTLDGLVVDGQPWPAHLYDLSAHQLIIKGLPDACHLTLTTLCQPASNSSLMGLYLSGQHFFTQCEAQGFRRITWFADRPDVMSVYTVTLQAKQSDYPILLSNGNLIRSESLQDGQHVCVWHDPHPKPCYLFALVAGQFECREKHLRTQSGRDVLLQIYSDLGTISQTEWAMQCLEQSVRWDEQRFNLELDLDRFMIVAARDFNMGAMENKGLNIFNAAYVLADPQTASDASFLAVQAVIGHEYFHNWTGNRVTCRDWFDLSLKEGLTVFRDQCFTADMLAQGLNPTQAASARAVKRIDDVNTLRSVQFPEDNGPMAHPIRPESYQEISNFYTATVYEKGAEVIRMMHTLLGEETFQLGMRLYFERHDGQAVTCDDFVNAMASAWQTVDPSHNLNVFRRWYRQAGTPRVSAQLTRHQDGLTATLTLTQHCDPVGVERESGLIKQAFHIPFALGFVAPSGQPLTLDVTPVQPLQPIEIEDAALNHPVSGQTVLLNLIQPEQSWLISGLKPDAVPSYLRDFSAPVYIESNLTAEQLRHLAQHDTNAFVRWESSQTLIAQFILRAAQHWRQTGQVFALDSSLLDMISAHLTDGALDDGYRARLLSLPSDKYLMECAAHMDPLAIAHIKRDLQKQLGLKLGSQLEAILKNATVHQPYEPTPQQAGKRSLTGLLLTWLMSADNGSASDYALSRYAQADNLTERFNAMAALSMSTHHHHHYADTLTHFYETWQHEALVIDKWFALQATNPQSHAASIEALMQHPAFNLRNPNRARSVIFQFCANNPIGFHKEDGSGYAFWANQVVAIDALNPEIAARLARIPDHWARHVEPAKSLMQKSLQTVHAYGNLSSNTREIVSKALTL